MLTWSALVKVSIMPQHSWPNNIILHSHVAFMPNNNVLHTMKYAWCWQKKVVKIVATSYLKSHFVLDWHLGT